ncbi:hypothetical protein TNCT_700891 [Trichonephila clavata]|uniref:Uncharacterized protein n=2 Tax=Trichonephila TaxID=2585208 RepID=A0A8X6L255_TRICU|nr:hypothetical protein TNCT_700891 [Trichonephila clavata]GFS34903.1 hypothetical protein TNIN_388721 [Trichonephila inaurata madagascariensis]
MRLSTHSIESGARGSLLYGAGARSCGVDESRSPRALGPDAVGRGYYFTLETALEGSGVETLGTWMEEKANFPTSSFQGRERRKRYLQE